MAAFTRNAVATWGSLVSSAAVVFAQRERWPGGYRSRRTASLLLVVLTLSLCSVPTRAATAPYADNFDSYPAGSSPSHFITRSNGANFPSASWQIASPDGTNGSYLHSLAGVVANSSAAISITNLAPVAFVLSTTFVLNTPFLSDPFFVDCRVGLGALGAGPDFSTSGYQLSYQTFSSGNLNAPPPGALTLYRGTTFIGGWQIGTARLPVVIGDAYTMTLSGVYSAAGLTFTATLSNGSSTIAFSALDAAPAQGTYFGYYNKASGRIGHSVATSVDYDNFSISVPEPGTTALLATGAVVVLIGGYGRHRRRRSARRS